MFPSQEDIERIIAMEGSDRGFFVLALFSFIEAYVRNELGYADSFTSDSTDTFPDLIHAYSAKLEKEEYLPYKTRMLLKSLPYEKQITNSVRHRFARVSPEEMTAAISVFCSFTETCKITGREQFARLTKELEIWNSRRTPIQTAMELNAANRKIAELQKQNAEIIRKSSEYQDISAELGKIRADYAALQAQLTLEQARSHTKDAQYNEMRQKNYETARQLKAKEKELQEKLTDYHEVQSYIENLQRMSLYTRTRRDYEKSLIRLTPEQQNVLDRIKLNHDFLVRGAAGTGKSLVLLKALENTLTSNPLFGEKPSVALLTYTKSLAKYNTYIAKLMDMGLKAENIHTVDSFLLRYFHIRFPDKTLSLGNDEEYKQYFPDIPGFKAAQILHEACTFIWPQNITEKEYCTDMIDRTGMFVPVKEEQRKMIWKAVSTAEQRMLQESSTLPRSFVYRILANSLAETDAQNTEKTDYIFIDEAQDLTAAQLFILKKLSRYSVILAGDTDQNIFLPSFAWKRAGIDVSGYSCILQTNFRNTVQITEAAEKYRSLIPGMNKESQPASFRMGPPVELTQAPDTESLYTLIAEKAALCISQLSYDPCNICIIAPKLRDLNKIAESLTTQTGLASQIINDDSFDFESTDTVRLSTMQSCKGLDFPVVLFLLDHRSHLFQNTYDEKQCDRMERSLVYVAMTRAMDMLNVFIPDNAAAEIVTSLKGILQQ